MLLKRYGAQKPPPGTPLERSHPLAVGLRDAWVLAEGSGRNTYNAANFASSGTMQNAANTWGTGKGGVAFDNGAAASGIKVFKAWNLGFATAQPFTVAARVYPTSITSYKTVYADAGGNNGLMFKAGKLAWYPKIDGTSPTTVQNRWADIAATYDGSVLRLWLDGVQEQSYTGSMAGFSYYNTGVFIGGDGTDTYNGLIEYVNVYQRALSVSDLQQLRVEPFGMYRKRRIFIYVPPAPASTTIFRRTLSSIGTRTGSRQLIGV